MNINKICYYTICLSSVFLILCFFIMYIYPNQFQKFNSIKSIQKYKQVVLSTDHAIDINDFINKIPYNKNSAYVWSVHPEKKYEKAFLKGHGDCSTMSFGAAYELLKQNVSFEIVHFLPLGSLFSGGGHVAMRFPYKYKREKMVGIVDLAGGGLPIANGMFLDVGKLDENINIKFHRINNNASEYYDTYYQEKYLENTYIGRTPASEISRYFDFISLIYISLGHKKIEKKIYDGLAIFLNQYYSIYVSDSFIVEYQLEITFFKYLLYCMRLFFVILIIFITCLLTCKIRLYIKKINKCIDLQLLCDLCTFCFALKHGSLTSASHA